MTGGGSHTTTMWLGASRDGGSALGSIGHSPSHALQRDSPLSEGAKVIVRLPYAEPAERKASPGGWCSAQRIKRDMTAGGSHTFSALAQRQLRLMRSKLKIITMG